jgi:hypothetical protein
MEYSVTRLPDTIAGLPDTYRIVSGVPVEPGGRVYATDAANGRAAGRSGDEVRTVAFARRPPGGKK